MHMQAATVALAFNGEPNDARRLLGMGVSADTSGDGGEAAFLAMVEERGWAVPEGAEA